MPYRLRKRESVRSGVRRIAREQIDRAQDEIADMSLDRHEAVHQVRKRCKKVRGLVRLIRDAAPELFQRENARFRDAARRISSIRDAESVIEAFDELSQHSGGRIDDNLAGAVRKMLVARRRRLADEVHDLDARLEEFAGEMRSARDDVTNWELETSGFAAIEGGLKRTYRRGRKAMKESQEEAAPENLHEWRKRVKYHWYHARLLDRVFARGMKKRRRKLKRLADLLGDDRDLVLLAQVLREHDPSANGRLDLDPLFEVIEACRKTLQSDAFEMGRRLYRRKPKKLVKKVAQAWKEMHQEKELSAAGG